MLPALGRRRFAAACLWLLAGGGHPWGSAQVAAAEGDDSCWMGALQYETCCLPPPDGNPFCWDQYFTAARCCTRKEEAAPAPPPPAPPPPPPAPPSLFGGCEWDFFQEFKHRVSAWYGEGKAALGLFHQFGLITNQFEDVFASCPPAALTAMLLKLETAFYEDDAKWADLLDIYMKAQHRAVAEGTLVKSHHENGWPLVAGLNRALGMRARGRRFVPFPAAADGGNGTSEGGPPRPPVDLVVCYCSERLVWLRAFHKVPWRSGDRSQVTRAFVALRVYHKCPSADPGEREEERQRLVRDWGSYFHTVEVRYVDDAARADDCSAYLAYIMDRYDTLPDTTFFLHADAPEHIPSIDLLTDTVFAAGRGYLPPDLGFAHLAHNYVLHDLSCKGKGGCEGKELDQAEFPTLWKRVFGSSIAPSLAAGNLNAYCCVQFLARPHSIRLRPKSFYERAFAYFGETAESYHRLFPAGRVVRKADVRGRTPCQLAMYIWHAMFGEPLKLPRRQADPKVPLFMKLHNIEVEALDDEENSNDPYVESMIAGSMQVEQEGRWSSHARVNSLFDEPSGAA